MFTSLRRKKNYVCTQDGGMGVPKPLWIRPEYIKAILFKSVPKSSWWKTPLQEHNNGLQSFPSAHAESPATARVRRVASAQDSFTAVIKLFLKHTRMTEECQTLQSMEASAEIQNVPMMRFSVDVVPAVRLSRRTQQGSGAADWWLQLSQRRGTQADSWSPVAPDLRVIEARGIVFHCRGQPVQPSSEPCLRLQEWRIS